VPFHPKIGSGSGGGSYSSYTVGYADLSAAALTKTVTIASGLSGKAIHGIIIKVVTPFAGTSITSCKVQLGDGTTADRFTTSYELVGTSANDNKACNLLQGLIASTNVVLTATAVGANLSALTQGSLKIYILTESIS